LIEGIRKRNLNPPVLNFTRKHDIVEYLWERFFSTFIDEEKFSDCFTEIPMEDSFFIR